MPLEFSSFPFEEAPTSMAVDGADIAIDVAFLHDAVLSFQSSSLPTAETVPEPEASSLSVLHSHISLTRTDIPPELGRLYQAFAGQGIDVWFRNEYSSLNCLQPVEPTGFIQGLLGTLARRLRLNRPAAFVDFFAFY
jgi:hypothetical protein